jgi:hypothetical protein
MNNIINLKKLDKSELEEVYKKERHNHHTDMVVCMIIFLFLYAAFGFMMWYEGKQMTKMQDKFDISVSKIGTKICGDAFGEQYTGSSSDKGIVSTISCETKIIGFPNL